MPDVIVPQPVESTGDRSKPGAAFRIDVDRTVVRGRKTFARICCAAGISTEKLCMLALLSFGCAVVSYKIVEQPFRERSTPAIPLLKQYGVLALVMILAAGALYASRDIVHGDGPLKQLV